MPQATESNAGATTPPSRTPSGETVVDALSSPTLVGRTAELAALFDAWFEAKAGRGSLVMLEGAAGAGKSRLLAELQRRARADDGLVMWYGGLAAVPLPYAALSGALDGLLLTLERDPARASRLDETLKQAMRRAGALLGRFNRKLAAMCRVPLDQNAIDYSQEHLFEAVADLFLSIATAMSPALLLLDDSQWLDPGSRQTLRRLAQRLGSTPLLVVVAQSTNDEAAFVNAELRDLASLRLELQPLNIDDVARLCVALMPRQEVEPDFVEQLAVASGGMPWAVLAFLRAAHASGLITVGQPANARCLQTESGHWLLPKNAETLLQERLEALSVLTRRALEVAAVCGAPIAFDLVARACDCDAQAAEQAFTEARQAGLVIAGPAGLGFSCGRVPEALLRRLSEGERQRIHARVASFLEERPNRSDDDVFAIAHHWWRTNQSERQTRAYFVNLEAGQRALQMLAADEAQVYLQNAVIAAEQTGRKIGVDLDIARGELCFHRRRYYEAAAHFKSALASTTDRLARARLRERLCRVRIVNYDFPAAREEMTRAFAEIGHKEVVRGLWPVFSSILHYALCKLGLARRGPERRELHATLSRLHDLRATVAFFDYDIFICYVATTFQLNHALLIGDSRELCTAYTASAVTAAALGWSRMARHYCATAAEIAGRIGDPVGLARAMGREAICLHLLGESAKAEELARRVLSNQSRWLDTNGYLDTVGELLYNLYNRGYMRDAFDVSFPPFAAESPRHQPLESTRLQRHLDALLQVSLASVAASEPEAQARIALDEVVRLIGAERAFLFMRVEGSSRLKLRAGRDANGNDLFENDQAGVDRSVVERVLAERRAVVVGGPDDPASALPLEHKGGRHILAAPLTLRNRTFGVVYLDTRLGRNAFAFEDIQIITAIANHIAIALETARVNKLELERKSLETDLELTAAVQSLFLPDPVFFDTGRVMVKGHYEPTAQCGGDWWWYGFDREENLVVLVGDVTGHGVASAMVTAAVASSFITAQSIAQSTSVQESLDVLNRNLIAICGGQFRMTVSAVEVNPNANRLSWWAAGVPPIFVMTPDGEVETFVKSGRPLGRGDLHSGRADIAFPPGSTALIFTDGLTEVHSGGRPLGLRQLRALFRQTQSMLPGDAANWLSEQVHALARAGQAHDDITFVYIAHNR